MNRFIACAVLVLCTSAHGVANVGTPPTFGSMPDTGPTPVLGPVVWQAPGSSTVTGLVADGAWLAASTSNREVFVFDTSDAAVLSQQYSLAPGSQTSTGPAVQSLFVDGDRLLVLYSSRLRIHDLGDSTLLQESAVPAARGLAVVGPWVLVTTSSNKLLVFESSDLSTPALEAPLPHPPTAVTSSEDQVYVALPGIGIHVLQLDLASGECSQVGTVPLSQNIQSLGIQGNKLIAQSDTSSTTLSIQGPGQLPMALGRYPDFDPQNSAPAFGGPIQFNGSTLFWVNAPEGLTAISNSLATSPEQLWSLDSGIERIACNGSQLFGSVGGSLYSVKSFEPLGTPNTPEVNLESLADLGAQVTISGSLAYIANRSYGLDVLDLNFPDRPKHIGEWNPPSDSGQIYDFVVVGQHGYAARAGGAQNGIQVLSLVDKFAPEPISSVDAQTDLVALEERYPYLYAASPSQGLVIYDIADPLTPLRVGVAGPSGNPQNLVLNYPFVFLFESISFQVIDVSNPASPSSEYAEPSGFNTWADGGLIGNTLIRIGKGQNPGITLFDVTDPTTPSALGPNFPFSNPAGIATDGPTAYIALGGAGFARVTVIDSAPVVDTFSTSGLCQSEGNQACAFQPNALAAFGLHLIATDSGGKIASFRLGEDLEPDCNGNGIPDPCEIEDELVADVDCDGIPDDCDSNSDLACGTEVIPEGEPPFEASLLIERVSLSSLGQETNVELVNKTCPKKRKNNAHPYISDDGDLVAWGGDGRDVLEYENLNAPGAQSKRQVYARRIAEGKTTIISHPFTFDPDSPPSAANIPYGNGPSDYPSISGNGAKIAFYSGASDLVPFDENEVNDIFIYDVQDRSVQRVSERVVSGVPEGGNQASARIAAISDTGRFIAFESKATNLHDPADYPDESGNELVFPPAYSRNNIFLWDEETNGIEWLSVGRNGKGGYCIPTGESDFPSITGDGTKVVFGSKAPELVPGTDPATVQAGRVFLFDRTKGSSGTIRMVDTPLPGSGLELAISRRPDISDDGTWIAFESQSTGLVTTTTGIPPTITQVDTNSTGDIYIAEVETGNIVRVELGALNATLQQLPRLSGNGRYLAFTSGVATVKPVDCVFPKENSNEFYVMDRDADGNMVFDIPTSTDAVSLIRLSDLPNSEAGEQASDTSGGNTAISKDGRWVVFMSDADNFVQGDQNGNVVATEDDCACSSGRTPPTRWGRDVFRRKIW